MLIHASTVALDNQAIIITGSSGMGKSDIALRLIVEHGAQLVSDDQTDLRVVDGVLTVRPPATIAGLIEVRHVGLLRLPYCAEAKAGLIVTLVPMSTDLPRLPENDALDFLGHTIPRLSLPAFAASTPAKIIAALRYPRAM